MLVNVVECFEGARLATGIVVVVDVFRAFSVACYAVENGAVDYYAVDNVDLARKVAKDREALLIGERDCIKVNGFDYGNSPTEIENVDFSGKTVVHTTSAGTKGLIACTQADEVLTGAFVNANAIIEYIRNSAPEVVTIVAIGSNGIMRAQEDMMCAMYIKNELDGYPNSFKTLKKFLSTVDSAEKFFDDSKDFAPERDFELCMNLDRFDFVLKAEPVFDSGVRLKIITV
jgi:2-phosphosulfolactate phosphatase